MNRLEADSSPTDRQGWRPGRFRRPNPVFTTEYAVIREIIVEARMQAGITQRELAARIGKTPSHLSLVERGQRRIDVLEFYYIARQLGTDFVTMMQRVSDRLEIPPTVPTHMGEI